MKKSAFSFAFLWVYEFYCFIELEGVLYELSFQDLWRIFVWILRGIVLNL